MKIVAHNGAPIFGGAEIATSVLLQGLQRRGHEVALFCNCAPVAAKATAYGLETELVPLGGDAALHHAVRFARAVRRRAPRALLLATFRKLWLGALGGRWAGVPWTVTRIGLETDVPRNAKYRVVFRRWIDAVGVNADDLRRLYLRALPDYDPRRIVTIYKGFEPSRRTAAPGAVRRSLGLPEHAAVIGSIARLAEQKRFDRLLGALALLPPHVHCVIAGAGETRAAIEAEAERLGVRGRLHLLGFRGDVADVLDALDVFVVSSDRESLANAMLEAMAAGVPVVSTPVSGAGEALAPLPDGSAPGVVISEFDAAALAAAAHSLLADPHARALAGRAGRRRVAERFVYDRMLDQWEALLAGDLDAAAAPAARAPVAAAAARAAE